MLEISGYTAEDYQYSLSDGSETIPAALDSIFESKSIYEGDLHQYPAALTLAINDVKNSAEYRLKSVKQYSIPDFDMPSPSIMDFLPFDLPPTQDTEPIETYEVYLVEGENSSQEGKFWVVGKEEGLETMKEKLE